jgi:hypothetical protein
MHPTKEKRRRNYIAGGTNKSLGLRVWFPWGFMFELRGY